MIMFMEFSKLKQEVDAITTDWQIKGPYHEGGDKYHALLRNEWVGNGFDTRRKALDAIYEQLRQDANTAELVAAGIITKVGE